MPKNHPVVVMVIVHSSLQPGIVRIARVVKVTSIHKVGMSAQRVKIVL